MIRIWDTWTTSLTLFCRFVAALGLKESQPGEIIPIIFYQFKLFLFLNCFTVAVLFGEIGTHPNVVFLQLVRFRGWVSMKNNETCNAPKCLKPTGLIDWVNCCLCNGWVHIKCANLSRAEARSLAEFKCCRCSSVNTIPQCQVITSDQTHVSIQALFTWKESLKILESP